MKKQPTGYQPTLQEVLDRLERLERKFNDLRREKRQAEEKTPLRYLDLTEACQFVGLSRTTFYRYMRSGHIPFTMVGKQRKFFVEDLENFVRKGYLNAKPDSLTHI